MRRILNHPAVQMSLFTFGWAIVEPLGAFAGVPAYQVVWTRYAVHLAFLAVVFGPRRKLDLVRSPRLFRQILRSLLMLVMPLSFIWAMQTMAPQNVLSVFWIAPVLVIVMAAFTNDQRVGLWTLLATVTGLVGTMLILKPNVDAFQPSALLAVTMAACLALYIVMTRAMRDEIVLSKLFHTALWVFISLSFALPFFWQTPTLRGILAMIGIGLLGLFSLYMLERAVDHMPSAQLAPVLYTQVAWELLIQWSGHATTPDKKAILGFVLVLAAAIPPLLRRPTPQS